MKKVLIYGNRKQDDEIWDVSTPELLDKACLDLFSLLNDNWQVYTNLLEIEKGVCIDCSGEGIINLKSGGEIDCPTCDGPSLYYAQEQRTKQQQCELYKKALAKDAEATFELLKLRKTYEYEECDIYNVNS